MTELLKAENPHTEYLRTLRDNWSDEIPDNIIHGPISGTDKKQFKVRRNWWQGVVGSLGRLQLKGLISPEMNDEVTEFIAYYTSDQFTLTTPDDIQRANALITRIISDNR